MTMTVAGHTLGTPGMSVPAALRLFRDAGLQAAEIIWQDDYSAGIPERGAQELLDTIKRESAEYGMSVCCLTPYMTALNSVDSAERRNDRDRFRRCLDDAAFLGARRVRVYAGDYRPEQLALRKEKWDHLVESLSLLATYAAEREIVLAVENHFNTMALTAQEAADLMKAVQHPAVGILYDQANLTFTHSEEADEAVDLQAPWIAHAHVKDLEFVDRERAFSASSVAVVSGEERAVRSRAVGDGEMDWADIIRRLNEIGYEGYLSLEYERRWHADDLPPPSEGFARSAAVLRSLCPEIVR